MPDLTNPKKVIESIFLDHSKSVFKWLLYKGASKAIAEEIVQDSFIKLYERIHDIDISKSKAWLISTAENAYLDYLKKSSTKMEDFEKELNIDNAYMDDSSGDIMISDCVTRKLNEFRLKDPEKAYVISLQLDDKSGAEIATLQDLGFVVDKADLDLGSVSATKLSGYALRMTVNVRPGTSGKSMIVRANAQYNTTAVTDPKPYQDFFVSLQKSMFLTANNVD